MWGQSEIHIFHHCIHYYMYLNSNAITVAIFAHIARQQNIRFKKKLGKIQILVILNRDMYMHWWTQTCLYAVTIRWSKCTTSSSSINHVGIHNCIIITCTFLFYGDINFVFFLKCIDYWVLSLWEWKRMFELQCKHSVWDQRL